MKHILKINELNKQTYIDAANKLSELGHFKRSNNLYKYVDELHGDSNNAKYDVDKMYYHPFTILNDDKCYIIETFKNPINSDVFMFNLKSSKTGNEYEIIYHRSIDKLNVYRIIDQKRLYLNDNFFKFSNRIDAIKFFKFLREEYPNVYFKQFKINKFYSE